MIPMNRRAFMNATAGAIAGAAMAGGPARAQGGGSLVSSEMRKQLADYFDGLCAWIMKLDVGSNLLKGTKDTATSIFINGNFARVLLASYRIAGDKAHLDEALRWCDTFCSIQQPAESSKGGEVGFWPDCGPKGNIYFGDAGTAVHALASVYHEADAVRQKRYVAAMERYARFVIDGCARDPQDAGRAVTDTWVIRDGVDVGALGCGYYRGKLSVEPYTIATATTGTAFMAELYAITGKREYKEIATNATKWLLETRKEDGEIPYTLAGRTLNSWPLDTMSYCAEGFVAADLLLKGEAIRAALRARLAASVRWLLEGQNADGSWGTLRSADQQRSPRAVTLLTWAYPWTDAQDAVAEGVRKYCAFLLKPENSRAYGVKELVRTTGFVGLTLADVLKPNCTF